MIHRIWLLRFLHLFPFRQSGFFCTFAVALAAWPGLGEQQQCRVQPRSGFPFSAWGASASASASASAVAPSALWRRNSPKTGLKGGPRRGGGRDHCPKGVHGPRRTKGRFTQTRFQRIRPLLLLLFLLSSGATVLCPYRRRGDGPGGISKCSKTIVQSTAMRKEDKRGGRKRKNNAGIETCMQYCP